MKRKGLNRLLAVIVSAAMILGTGIVALAEEGFHEHSFGDAYYCYNDTGHWLQRNCTQECSQIQYSPDGNWDGASNSAGGFAPARHVYSNGKCTTCGYDCTHTTWNNETGKCTTCDYECQHNNGWTYLGPDTEKCKCNVCGYMITHSGGTATCSTKAVCERCGGSYGSYDAENHEYSEWEVNEENEAAGHIRYDCCEMNEPQSESHTFDTSTHKCTECGYECTHPENPDDCSICGYKKPAAPQPEESQVEESKSEEPKVEEVKVEEVETQSSVTVTAVPATVPSNDLSSKVVIEKVSSGSPVTVDISKSNAGVVPVSFVESIAKVSNAVVNLKISDSVQLGVTSSTLKGAVAAPIVVKAVEPKLLTAMLPALTLNANIPSDKKLIVMSPVQGATSQNTAAIYQFYGPEMAGKIVTFYAMDATGKFKVLCQSVVYPNGYAAFSVPVTGFVGFAE